MVFDVLFEIGEVFDAHPDSMCHRCASPEVDACRTGAEQELARLADQQHALNHAVYEMASLKDYCSRVQANLQALSMDEKRLALESLHITVVWHPDKPLEIHGSIPRACEHSTLGCAANLARH